MSVRVRARGRRLEDKLKALATRGADEATRGAAEALLSEVEDGFRTKSDPRGRRWDPRTSGGAHPLLDRTGRLKQSFDVAIRGDYVAVTSSAPYAAPVNARRPIVPQQGLPDDWRDSMDHSVVVALERLGGQ